MPEHQEQINQHVKEDINELYRHASVANKEMGEVKELLSVHSTDLGWIKESMKKIDDRTWYILAVMIAGFLVEIILKVK